MKRNSLLLAGTAIALVAMTSASFTTSRTIINHDRYDTVDISLKMPAATDEDGDGLATPNEDITFVPEVSNRGAEAYIRIRPEITVTRADGRTEKFDASRIASSDSDWVRNGDCFYRMKKLGEDATVTSAEKFRLPKEWGNEYQNSSITIRVDAEAVQSRNFARNGNIIDAWKPIGVEKTVRSRTCSMEAK
jgi:hypothetical protein